MPDLIDPTAFSKGARKAYAVTIYINVIDPDALARAAARVVASTGIDQAEWSETRASVSDPVAADLRMLLDPGTSPDGCEILNSSAEQQ